MTIKNWQWPPSKISFKDLFQEYGCDGSSDIGSGDSAAAYNEIVTVSKYFFVTGSPINFSITNAKPDDNFKYSFDVINTITPSLDSSVEIVDSDGTKTVNSVGGSLTPGQYELSVYFIQTGNTRKVPVLVQELPTTTTTTLNPSVFNPVVELISDTKTLVHTLVPGSLINFSTSNEFDDDIRVRIQYGPPNAAFKISITDPNNQTFFISENLAYNGSYTSNYITLGTLGAYNFQAEFTDGSFSGTILNGRIRRVATVVALPVIAYNEGVILSPTYWTVNNSSTLRIYAGKPNTGFKYSIDPPGTLTPTFGTTVYNLDSDGKYLNSSFGTTLAVGTYELNIFFLGTNNTRKYSFTVAAATVTNQSSLWSIQVLPNGQTSYVPAGVDLPSPFTNTITRIFNEGENITFRITAPKTYIHWWKTLGTQYASALGSSVIGAGPNPPTYTISQGHEVYFGLGEPISKPSSAYLTATKAVNFVLTSTCNNLTNTITQSAFTGGSGEYQLAVKTGADGGQWFTTSSQATNPFSLNGGNWVIITSNVVKTNLPDGTYFFALRDLHDFNNITVKSIVVNCASPCANDNSLSIWDTDIDTVACLPPPQTINNPHPVDACTDATIKNVLKVKLSTPTSDGYGYYGDATIKFKNDLRNDGRLFAVPYVDDPQLYNAAKNTYNSTAYRRMLSWGNLVIENSSVASTGSGTLTQTDKFYELADLPETEVYLVFRLIGGGGAGGAADIEPGTRQISMGGRGGHGGIVHGILKLPATPGMKKKLLGGVGVNGGGENTVATGFGFSSSNNFQAHGALGASHGDAAGISGRGGQGGGATSLSYQVGSTIIPIATAGGGGGGGGASWMVQSEWVKSGQLSPEYGTFINTYGISTRLTNAIGTFFFRDLFYARAGAYKITFSGDNLYTIKIDDVIIPTVNNNWQGSDFHAMTLSTSGDKVIEVTLTNIGGSDNPNSIGITIEYLGAVNVVSNTNIPGSTTPVMIWTTLDYITMASVGRPQTADRIIDVYTNTDLNGTPGIKPNSDGGGGGGGGGNQGQGGLGGQDLGWAPNTTIVAQGGTNGRASKNTTVVLNESNWIYFDYIQPRAMTTNDYGNANYYGSGGLFNETNQFLDTAGIWTRTTPGAPGAISFYYTTDISNLTVPASSDLKVSKLPDLPKPNTTISFKDVSTSTMNVDAVLILFVDGSAKYQFDVWDRWSSSLNNGIGNQYEFRLDYVSGDPNQFNSGSPRDYRGRPITQPPSAINTWVNFDGKTMLYWRANAGSYHVVDISVRRRSDGFLVVNKRRTIIVSSFATSDTGEFREWLA